MVDLAFTDHGGGDAPPLLIAHGLFGSGRNWGAVAKRLSSDRVVRVVDMRNHGGSPQTAGHRYEHLAADLAAAIDEGWDILGHSMGGKAAMMLALTHPGKVRRLVVADIAPVRYTHTQAHLIDAMKSLNLEELATRKDADRALAELVDTDEVRAFLLQSLDIREKRWVLNLDTLEREMEGILGWPHIDATFDGPALFLSGAESSYLTEDGKEAARGLFVKARFAAIPGAGHWLHAEKPREVVAAVRTFLGN